LAPGLVGEPASHLRPCVIPSRQEDSRPIAIEISLVEFGSHMIGFVASKEQCALHGLQKIFAMPTGAQ